MRILKLHEPQGHPYWQAGEYGVELPDGSFVRPMDYMTDNYGGYRIYWNEKGVWLQQCSSGSGYGKVDRSNCPPRLVVSSNAYDKIEFVGDKKEMSDTLKQDLRESGFHHQSV